MRLTTKQEKSYNKPCKILICMLYKIMDTTTKKFRLVYLKESLEISRCNGWGDVMAMWNIYGFNDPCYPDGTTLTLETIKNLRKGE